jgi:HD-like signal output (HDOD) protein
MSESHEQTGVEPPPPRYQIIEDLSKELAGDVVFPTAFDLVVRLRKAFKDPELSVTRLAELISLDPLISARLIGMASSVYYNRNGQTIKSVKTAVQRLGLNRVRNVVMAVAMNQLLHAKDLLPFAALAEQLWHHSLRAAAAAEVVAGRMTHMAPDEAMAAGLMHDLGAFFILYRAARYPELAGKVDAVKVIMAQWHEQIGFALLTALGLPEVVADAARDHDVPRPCPDPPRNLADIVYVANRFAEAHGDSPSRLPGPIPDYAKLTDNYIALAGEVDEREREMLHAIGG